PVAEVDQLLGVADGPFSGHAVASVAGVGGGDRIAAAERVGELRIAELPSPDAVADADELTVPATGGKPDLDLDVAVAARRESRLDAAELGQVPVRGGRHARGQVAGKAGLLECTGSHEGGGSYRSVGQCHLGQFAAFGGR